ncbi:MAG: tRNA (adenosine(37)-N6)-threonylcarbamoyltransferase complex ATPase subunit type 1 TsaE [Hyphomonadaceae bacterium]
MNTRVELYLPNEAATARLGAALAGILRAGDVIALNGDLGAGKTTLARGLIRTLCGNDIEVPSPTYTLVQAYDARPFTLWHFDLYRLETPEEIIELGWDDTTDGVILVEWPGRAGRHLPKLRLDLTLKQDGDGRIAALEPRGEDWQDRLHDLSF